MAIDEVLFQVMSEFFHVVSAICRFRVLIRDKAYFGFSQSREVGSINEDLPGVDVGVHVAMELELVERFGRFYSNRQVDILVACFYLDEFHSRWLVYWAVFDRGEEVSSILG